MKIRTRFAPSPTGRMHVGNLRTALYAFLVTKHEDGDFILRIEDTDQERLVEGAVDIIYRTLKSTGLVHDEGPDKDKGFGPYVQSDRQASGIYLEYAKKLVEEGKAYYCFCTKDRLENLTQTIKGEDGEEKVIHVYDKHCLALSKEEVEANLKAGMPYVIRQNNPQDGTTSFNDDIYGEITVNNIELDDMILIKSDGYPTYNFANVIDDHLMGITHVVRGNEYLSSTPKYNRLYEAFGWDVPVYIHCPLITDEEHKKLSKRCGHSSYEDLIEQGFLKDAVVNFVALLGWSPDDNVEKMSLQELIEKFDYHHISKSPAVFDYTKLKWLNGEYFKAMEDDVFYNAVRDYADVTIAPVCEGEDDPKADLRNKIATLKRILTNLDSRNMNVEKIMKMVRTRIEVFTDIIDHIDFFETMPEYDIDMYNNKKSKCNPEVALNILNEVLPVLEGVDDFTNDTLFATLSEYAASKEYKTGLVMWPIRTAVSGKQMTPGGATELMEILGKEESIARIKAGIAKLS